jgi:hypothetical protein
MRAVETRPYPVAAESRGRREKKREQREERSS